LLCPELSQVCVACPCVLMLMKVHGLKKKAFHLANFIAKEKDALTVNNKP
jgi:hypothetical protein